MVIRAYLSAAVWVCLFGFAAHVLAPAVSAAVSVWGFAPGWQHEIGFFNLAMAMIAFSALRIGDLRCERAVSLALVVLTATVGTNHFATVLYGTTSRMHEIFTVINYASVVF